MTDDAKARNETTADHAPSPPAAPEQRGPLPGDLSAKELRARILRVDHAGEYGAKRIYDGQLAVLGASPAAASIRHMAEQEHAHLKTFDALLRQERVRPTLLSPLWHVAGFALGAASAALGAKAAMACTEAVEDVIDAHYAAQAARLGPGDSALKTTIDACRADEIAHRDQARAEGAHDAPAYGLLRALTQAGTRLAIFLSERI